MVEAADRAFGPLLRAARLAAGLSQEALAEAAGRSARAISDLERGVNRAPRRDTLDALARALGLPDAARTRWLGAWRAARADRAGQLSTPPSLASTGARTNNLPLQGTVSIGRETRRWRC